MTRGLSLACRRERNALSNLRRLPNVPLAKRATTNQYSTCPLQEGHRNTSSGCCHRKNDAYADFRGGRRRWDERSAPSARASRRRHSATEHSRVPVAVDAMLGLAEGAALSRAYVRFPRQAGFFLHRARGIGGPELAFASHRSDRGTHRGSRFLLLQPLEEVLAKLRHFRCNHELTIALVRVTRKIFLMVFLGDVER
jgi:hypothetical protein